MDGRSFDPRELLISTVLLVALARLVEPPLLWGLAGLILVTTAVGTLQLLADLDPNGRSVGVPVESLIVPAVAAVAAVGAVRLLPIGLWLVPGLAVAALLVERTLASEAGLLASRQGSSSVTRTSVMAGILVVGFIAFLGAAASIPGGLPEAPGALTPAPGIRLLNLAILTGADALIAGLLGYRAAALRGTRFRTVLWSAISCAAAIAIAAAGLRAMAIPRLLGPALLVIVFYLWDVVHGALRADQRDARRLWEALLLGVAGVVVIVWSLTAAG